MEKHVIFRGLSPYTALGQVGASGVGKLSNIEEWKHINQEKYKIRKFFIENKDPYIAGKKISRLIDVHNIFLESLKKDTLREAMLRPRAPEITELDVIPLGITEDNKLICMEYGNMLPSIFICGQNGMGKSIMAHRIADYLYHLFKYGIIILNDFKIETKYWSCPNPYLDLRLLSETAAGLPIMMLSPTIRDMVRLRTKTPRLNIAIGWQEFIDKIDTFSSLGGSEKYFMNMRQALGEVEDFGGFAEKLSLLMPDKSDRAMRNKILAEFGKFMEARILKTKEQEISYNDDYFGYTMLYALKDDKAILEDIPIITLARLGVVPSVNTSDLKAHEEVYQKTMKYWLDRIIHKKNIDTKFRDEPLILYIDELSSFCSTKKKSPSISSVKSLVQKGRHLNLGSILVTQNPGQVDSDIITNCKYQILFGLPSEKDVALMAGNLSLDRNQKKELKNLQKFEALLVSKERELVIYDLDDNHWYRQSGIFKVHTFLSLGEHEEESISHQSLTTGRDNNIQTRGDWIRYAYRILDDSGIKLCQSREYTVKLDPMYDRVRHLPDERELEVIDQDKIFSKPKLIEGLSVASFFYDKSTNLTTISYKELMDKGFVIVTNLKNGLYEIRNVEKAKSERNLIIHSTKPDDIMFIAYDPEIKSARLFGKYVLSASRGITIGPLIQH